MSAISTGPAVKRNFRRTWRCVSRWGYQQYIGGKLKFSCNIHIRLPLGPPDWEVPPVKSEPCMTTWLDWLGELSTSATDRQSIQCNHFWIKVLLARIKGRDRNMHAPHTRCMRPATVQQGHTYGWSWPVTGWPVVRRRRRPAGLDQALLTRRCGLTKKPVPACTHRYLVASATTGLFRSRDFFQSLELFSI